MAEQCRRDDESVVAVDASEHEPVGERRDASRRESSSSSDGTEQQSLVSSMTRLRADEWAEEVSAPAGVLSPSVPQSRFSAGDRPGLLGKSLGASHAKGMRLAARSAGGSVKEEGTVEAFAKEARQLFFI